MGVHAVEIPDARAAHAAGKCRVRRCRLREMPPRGGAAIRIHAEMRHPPRGILAGDILAPTCRCLFQLRAAAT